MAFLLRSIRKIKCDADERRWRGRIAKMEGKKEATVPVASFMALALDYLWMYILVMSGSPSPCTMHRNSQPYLS